VAYRTASTLADRVLDQQVADLRTLAGLVALEEAARVHEGHEPVRLERGRSQCLDRHLIEGAGKGRAPCRISIEHVSAKAPAGSR
jgi:hypothetical protein